jgi:hypothetical protein
VSGRLARVHGAIAKHQAELDGLEFIVSPVAVDEASGFNRKVLLDGFSRCNKTCQYLHKPMPLPDAAKIQFVTVLTNLLGLETPIALCRDLHPTDSCFPVSTGTCQPFLQGYRTDPSYDFTRAAPRVLQYIFLSRWINELIGNLHCWWGQLLVPSDEEKQFDHVIMVDFDEAFCNVAPEFLYRALTETFHKKGVIPDHCQWLSRTFRFDAPVGWSPDTYDSTFSIYGPALKLYLEGRISLDMAELKRQVRLSSYIPAKIIQGAMEHFVRASTDYYRNDWIFVPAAENPKFSAQDFGQLFLARLRRSAEEFCLFLDELVAARCHKPNRLSQFYDQLIERPY